MAQERLDSIQILRAVAALAVMFAHLWPTLAFYGVKDAIPNFIFGASGVDLFFVISGFIMVYTSETMFGVNGASRGFLGRRLLRIVPLYWAMTTAILIMLFKLRGQLPDSSLILGSYLFIPVVHNGWQSEPILGVGWTLNHEMFFYACFAVAIMLPRRLAVLALSVALFAFTNAGSYFGFMMHAPLSVWAASFVCEFCFGMWIAAAYREGVRIPVVASVAVSAVGLALMIYTHIEAFTVISRVMGWGGGAALVVAGIVLADTTRKVPRVFRPLIILGEASFALYLIHSMTPNAFLVIGVPQIIHPQSHPLIYCEMLVAVSIAAALVLTRCEDWMRRRILTNWQITFRSPVATA